MFALFPFLVVGLIATADATSSVPATKTKELGQSVKYQAEYALGQLPNTERNEAQLRSEEIVRRNEKFLFCLFIIVSLILTVVGYSILSPTLFLTSYFGGGSLASAVIYYYTKGEYMGLLPPILAFVVVGLLLGVLALLMIEGTVFIGGVTLGLMLTFIRYPSITSAGSRWLVLVLLAGIWLALRTMERMMDKSMTSPVPSSSELYDFENRVEHIARDFFFTAEERDELNGDDAV